MRWLILTLLSASCFGQMVMPVLGSSGGSTGGGSFSFVNFQHNSGFVAATCNTGELCVLIAGVKGASGTIATVSDSTGDTWTEATSAHSPNNASLNETDDIWYLSQPAHTGTHTLTITAGGSGTITQVINQEFTGQASSSVLDVCTTGEGASTNPSVSITASTSNELLVVGMISDIGTATAGSGFSALDSGDPSATNFFEYWERNLASASGSNTAGFTKASSINYSLTACAFKHS